MKVKSFISMLVVLYAAAFLAGFNENLMNMGLVSLMRELGVDAVTAQWTVTGYMIVATVVVMCMAYLYRRYKLRTLFFVGAGFTIAGSVLGLVSPNFVVLMIASILQALGAGLFIPLMMNTVLVVTPKPRLGSFMSIGGAMITFGPALAPVVCGGLVTSFGWRSIFAAPLIAMVVLVVAGAVLLQNAENHEARLDVPSVVLSAVFLFALSFGLAQLTIAPVAGAVSLAIAVASAIVFVRRQIKLDDPLIDMSPMAKSTFWPAIVLVVVAMTTTFSLSVVLPLYLEGALGMVAFVAGIVILVPVLLNAATTLVGGRIMDAKGEWPLLPLGMLCMFIGVVTLAVAAPTMSLPAIFVGALFAYAGVGLVFSPSQTAGLRTLPPAQNPFGVALMTTFVQIAACIGPSMFIGIMSSTQAGAQISGATEEAAVAQGFSAAIVVAAVIVGIGLVTSVVFARAARIREAQRHASATVGAPASVAAGTAGAQATAEATEAPLGNLDLAEATVAKVMQANPYTVSSTTLVRDVMQALVENHVSGMPVVDDEGRAVGYVSDGDIMRYLADANPAFATPYAFIEVANSQTIDERLDELMLLPVSKIATDKVVGLAAGTSLKDACQLLATHRIKKLPILDDGRVVGTVNRSDVLRMAMQAYLGEPESGDTSR